MGRLEPSRGLAPPAIRRDARAKKAKATANKTIPALLPSYPRVRRGIEATELIVGIPPAAAAAAAANPGPKPPASTGPLRISLCAADTLATAHSLQHLDGGPGKPDPSNRSARVGILNMASPLSPGGGFFNGATSQEEFLCMRTTLLPSLRDGFYRLPERGAVFTPDVLVFRDDGLGDGEDARDLDKRRRWFIDCVSAAMLRLPDLADEEDEGDAGDVGGCDDDDSNNDDNGNDSGEQDEEADSPPPPPSRRRRYAEPRDRELVLEKMRVVLSVFQRKGVRRVVLGAWGCGAYGNPVGEVAEAWRKVLLGGPTGGKSSKSKKKKREKERKGKGDKGKKNGGGEEEQKEEEGEGEGEGEEVNNQNKWPGIEQVVFAIPNASTAREFERAFNRPDPLLQHHSLVSRNSRDENHPKPNPDDPEEAALRELEDKIRELEAQIQQARSPQLRAGLGAALAGLRARVPSREGGGDSDDGEGKEGGDDEDDE